MEQIELGKRRRPMHEQTEGEFDVEQEIIGPRGNGIVHNTNDLHPGLFTPPNMNCRVESFGRICQKFDERRTRWVCEMGFGGLLHLASHMHLPRQLAYWIMTRNDPINRCLIGTNDQSFQFSKNQVHWILGIPLGGKKVPTNKQLFGEVRLKVQTILLKYGRSWDTKPTMWSDIHFSWHSSYTTDDG